MEDVTSHVVVYYLIHAFKNECISKQLLLILNI